MKKRNLFKLAALTAVFALGSMFANAQIVTTDDAANIPVQGSSTPGTSDGTIKVIDNKGTVKYIQASNGITSFTNTATPGGVVTTFQLGGQLIDSTYIDVNGNKFGIRNLATAADGTGLQLVAIDGTGNLIKLDFTDLIQSGTNIHVVGASPATPYVITVPPTIVLPSYKTVYVYRNGAKLLAGVDYTIATDGTTLTINNGTAGTDYGTVPSGAYETFSIYQGDRIELQFVK